MKFGSISYKTVLNNLSEGVYFVDKDQKITFWNHGAEQITGYESELVLGSSCSANILMHIDDDNTQLCIEGCPLRDTLLDGKERRRNVYLHHRDGKRVPVWLVTMPLFDDEGHITGAAEIFGENLIRLQLQDRMKELEQMAYVDILTGVSNRRFIDITLNGRLQEFARYGWSFGLLFIDIDNFKQINDTYGHDVGDRVLKMVGGTLEANIRLYDRVGRWGGEEFIVLITNIADTEVFHGVAEKLRHLVYQSSITVGDKSVGVSVSIGATLVKKDDSVESIIKRADDLMYQSKKAGKNKVTLG